jgi:hypothetical protein
MAPIRLILACDTTGSMGACLEGIKKALQGLICILQMLLLEDLKICLAFYRDYSDSPVYSCSEFTSNVTHLQQLIAKEKPTGGGDDPEAGKTLLNFLIPMMDENTIVIWFTDAMMHSFANDSWPYHLEKEMEALGPNFNWFTLAKLVRNSGAKFLTVLPNGEFEYDQLLVAYYCVMGQVTQLPQGYTPVVISQNLLAIVLGYLGEPLPTMVERFQLRTPTTFDGLEEPKESYFSDSEYEPPCDHPTNIFVGTEYYPEHAQKVIQNLGYRNLTLEPLTKLEWGQIAKMIHDDADYQQRVIESLGLLLDQSQENLLAQISALGKVWRELNKIDGDGLVYLDKVKPLIDRMSQSRDVAFKEWNKNSFKCGDEIRRLMEFKRPLGDLFILVGPPMDQKLVLEIIRDLSPSTQKAVTAALGQVTWTSSHAELPQGTRFIVATVNRPLSYLPYLLDGETKFDKYGEFIMAMLVVLCGNTILMPMAEEALKRLYGKVIDFGNFDPKMMQTRACFYNIAFARLCMRVHALAEFSVLTPEEVERFQMFEPPAKCHRNLQAKIEVKVKKPFSGIMPDYHLVCNKCENLSSYTTHSSPSECGRCGFRVTYPDHPTSSAKNKDASVPDEGKSYFVNCRNLDCSCFYAVLNQKDLNVAPKCHSCRNGQPSSYLSCPNCTRKYACSPQVATSFAKLNPQGLDLCPTCSVHPTEEPTTVVHPTLQELMKENKEIIKTWGYEMAAHPFLVRHWTTFDIFAKKEHANAMVRTQPSEVAELRFKGSLILNKSEVVAAAFALVFGEITNPSCGICWEEFRPDQLHSSCGNDTCSHLSCIGCLQGHYGSASAGNLILEPMLYCPLCKKSPKFSALTRVNPNLYRVIKTKPVFSPSAYYGWCYGCGEAKKHSTQECAGGSLPNLGGKFKCEDCQLNQPITETFDFPKCPGVGCGIMTQKFAACNAIHCAVASCHATWCYVCGQEFPDGNSFHEAPIYVHLREVHGDIWKAERCYKCDMNFPEPSTGYTWGVGSLYQHVHDVHEGDWGLADN